MSYITQQEANNLLNGCQDLVGDRGIMTPENAKNTILDTLKEIKERTEKSYEVVGQKRWKHEADWRIREEFEPLGGQYTLACLLDHLLGMFLSGSQDDADTEPGKAMVNYYKGVASRLLPAVKYSKSQLKRVVNKYQGRWIPFGRDRKAQIKWEGRELVYEVKNLEEKN